MSNFGTSADSAGVSRSLEAQVALLLEKLDESSKKEELKKPVLTMIAEVRTLELWRAVIAECLATVFLVFLVCGSYAPWTGKIPSGESHLVIAVVTGLSMATLVHSFGQVSGGHINPAVTLALTITRHISPLRGAMFGLAQLGGGIAGAALLYGATSSGYNGDLGTTTVSRLITPMQGFAIELLLTFVVVFVAFSSFTPYKRSLGSQPVAIGLAYLTCSLVGLQLTGGSMNPARSLGPAFVMNKWDSHWVYWVAPLLGGAAAGLIYEYIFNPHRIARKSSIDEDSSSVGSDEDAYDECSKPPPRYNALKLQQYDLYKPASPSTTTSPLGYTSSLYGNGGIGSTYSAPVYKYDINNYGKKSEDIYSGSKSMYTKSPPLQRSSNLNRSQSVYSRPPAPKTDTYSRNISESQNLSKSQGGSGFTTLNHNDTYTKSNHRQDSVYINNKSLLIRPEPVYGHMNSTTYGVKNDSGDSSYSTQRGSGSYASSRSSVPPRSSSGATRSRAEVMTPNSIISGHSSIHTPISLASFHSPNPQY